MASLLIHIQFFLYLMRNAAPQYGYHENIYYQNPAQQYYQQPGQMDYREREPHTSHRRQWMRGDDALRKKKKIYYDSDEDDYGSKCSCDKCDNPSRRCRDTCNYNCDETTPYPERLLMPPVAPSVVFLSYPYPLMVPQRRPKDDDDEDESCSTTCSTTCSTKRTCTPDPCLTTDPCTTDPCTTDPCLTTDPCTTKLSSSTTTASTPSTTTCVVTVIYIYPATTPSPTTKKTLRMGSDDDFYNLIMNHARKNMRPVNDKYMLSPRRRTKPTWVPKYGIIPIPDKLSERLMSQLRAVKGHNRQGR